MKKYKLPTVKIQQHGNRYSINVDNVPYDLDQTIDMCNVSMTQLRKALLRDERETVVMEWIIKHDHGVTCGSKTYWHKDTPMWAQFVSKKTGICGSRASKKLTQWEKTGDMDWLLQAKVPTGPKTGTIATSCTGGDLAGLSGESRSENLKKIKSPSMLEQML